MTFEIKTTENKLLAAILAQRLPRIGLPFNRSYDAHWHEYMGNANDPKSWAKVLKMAELQVREEGAGKDSDIMLCAYVGGFGTNGEPYLVICDDYSINSGNLTMPAKLFVKNIFGYREIDGFEPRRKVEARKPQEIAKRLSAELPHFEIFPDRFYDSQRAEYRGNLNTAQLEAKSLGLAEFQVHVGGDKSEIDNMFCTYVAGINFKAPKPFIVVCDDCLANSGNLTMPAKLHLEDLADFRIVEGFK